MGFHILMIKEMKEREVHAPTEKPHCFHHTNPISRSEREVHAPTEEPR